MVDVDASATCAEGPGVGVCTTKAVEVPATGADVSKGWVAQAEEVPATCGEGPGAGVARMADRPGLASSSGNSTGSSGSSSTSSSSTSNSSLCVCSCLRTAEDGGGGPVVIIRRFCWWTGRSFGCTRRMCL